MEIDRNLFQKSKSETYVAEKFAKKPENETKLFSCDACGQTIEEKFNMKEHTNTNHVELIEVLETTKLKINEDTDLNKSVGMLKKNSKNIGYLCVHGREVQEGFEVDKNKSNFVKSKGIKLDF